MIVCGDALAQLKELAPDQFDCCVTSPPYWNLRDYGIDGQVGREKTPAAYVAVLVEIFDQVRRTLKPDGTLWLNLGDSYAAAGHGWGGGSFSEASHQSEKCGGYKGRKPPDCWSLKKKDLVGIPWRVAFALQEDGWWLRRDIVWHKPDPMPESCKDRPTTAHEYVFLMSKSEHYYYDAAAIMEATVSAGEQLIQRKTPAGWDTGPGGHRGLVGRYEHSAPEDTLEVNGRFRNSRSVWTIPTHAFAGAHFATMPEELARRCVLAGSRKGGVVLDPFAGAGTTGVVAKEAGRGFLGIELNPEYIVLAERRIAKVGYQPKLGGSF